MTDRFRNKNRFGGGEDRRQTFATYIDAFNRQDIAAFTSYYSDSVRMNLPIEKLEGIPAIAAFYEKMYRTLRETVVVRDVIADEGGIAADIKVDFVAIADAADFALQPLAVGDRLTAEFFVIYTLKDGLIDELRFASAAPLQKISA